MRVAELLAHLAKAESVDRGAYFRVIDDDALEYVGPSEMLTDGVRAFVTARKAAIIAWLRTPVDALPREDLVLFDYDPTLPDRILDVLLAGPEEMS